MPQHTAVIKNTNRNKIIFFFSLFMLLYWITGHVLNIYRFAVAGAIFELLWLPMLLSLIILPALAFIFWVKEKFVISSLNLHTIIIGITTILILVFAKSYL